MRSISSRPAGSTGWWPGRTGGSSMCRSQWRSRCRIASTPTAPWCGRRAGSGSASAMGEPGAPSGEEEALWRFSLAFYALPGVADALITLQDRRGLDVNLVLFALWLGISGRGALDRDLLAKAERATGTLRSEIVEPLRRLRRNFRHQPDGEVQQLREGVKAIELAGEKLVQARLARLTVPARRGVP